MSLQEYIDQEKRELATSASVTLLLAKLKMMQYEFFHELDEIKEAA